MNLLGPIYLLDYEASIIALQGMLMFIAYFVLLSGYMARVYKVSNTGGFDDTLEIIKTTIFAFLLVGIIATSKFWFDGLSIGFQGIAETVNADFGSEPFGVTEALMESIAEDPESEGWGIDEIINTAYLAMVYGAAKLAVTIASVFQIPFYILQYILKWMGFLFLPIALSLLIFPSLSSIGVKMIANLLAVLAWPIGFAITNLAVMGFINDFANSATYTGSDPGSTLYMMSFGSLLMGILGSLILVIGTLATPVIMFSLFASGTALQAVSGAATGAGMFAFYTASMMGFGRRGLSEAPQALSPSLAAAEGAGSTSGSEGIGATSYFEHPLQSTALQPYQSSVAAPIFELPSGMQQALPAPSDSVNALPAPPSDTTPPTMPRGNPPRGPSSGDAAARLFEKSTTHKPVITI